MNRGQPVKKKNLAAGLLFFIGIAVMLYPALSNVWNSRVQTRVINRYEETLNTWDRQNYTQAFARAEQYNEALARLPEPFLQYGQLKGYRDILDVDGHGTMGYLFIPKLGVRLPIRHSTAQDVLNEAVGHLEGSSLPVGGNGTHSVLSAHRGLPSAKLFTDLDRLETGDTFSITVLDRRLDYEITEIQVVEPHQLNALRPIEGKDCCTLMTCTPYAVNTHRLLVRGECIGKEQLRAELQIPDDAVRVKWNPLLLAVVLALFGLFLQLLIKSPRKEARV